MTELPDPPRRAQILAATLELLATTPLERLTTRAIAERVGVSQPALFRHFTSREALLLAVVQDARLALGAQLTALLAQPQPPLERCEALAAVLAAFIDAHPGFPRLLFADLAFDAPALRLAVRQLEAMPRTLVATLVAQAQDEGTARRDLQAQACAVLFVAMVQGLALQGLLAEVADGPPLAQRLPAVLSVWRAGLTPLGPQPPRAAPPGQLRAQALDVRPILARGVDPLADVLAAVAALAPGSLLVVTAPFRPRPLEALLTGKGHRVSAHAGPDGLWSLLVVVGQLTPCLDLRDLEPPEPLERLLSLAAQLPPGKSVLAHLPRVPCLLLAQLPARNLSFECAELADGSAVICLTAAA